jgi:hypothetical protein
MYKKYVFIMYFNNHRPVAISAFKGAPLFFLIKI